jgi:hypothetical protein
MQAGQQRNIGILQQNEDLKLKREAMNLRNYESMLKQMDGMMGVSGDLWGNSYQQRSQQRSQMKSAGGSLGGLNPMYARHAAIIRENQGIIDAGRARIDELGKAFFASGSKEPGDMFETRRGITNELSSIRSKLSQNSNYAMFRNAEQARQLWEDKIEEARLKGLTPDLEEIDKMDKRYLKWVNDPSSNDKITPSHFRINKYIYDGKDALSRISVSAAKRGLGDKNYKEIKASDGSLLAGTELMRPSLDEITDGLVEEFRNDRDVLGLFNNTAKGKLDDDGNKIEFDDWIREQARAHAPAEGREVSTTANTVINRADTKGTTTSISDYERLTGRKPSNDTEKSTERVMSDVKSRGFDPGSDGITNLTEVGRLIKSGTDNVKFLEDDETGELNVWETNRFDEDDGELEDRLVATFKRPKVKPKPKNMITMSSDWMKDNNLNITFKDPDKEYQLSERAVGVLKSLDDEGFNDSGLVLNSTYRDAETNAAVGGKESSFHLIGDAMDFSINTEKGKEFAKWLGEEDGKDWLEDNKYEVLIHDAGSGKHIHLEPSDTHKEIKKEKGKLKSDEGLGVEDYIKSISKDDAEAEDRVGHYLSDRLLAGLHIEDEEIDRILNNPPSNLRSEIKRVKSEAREETEDRKRWNNLKTILEGRDGGLTNEEAKQFTELGQKYGESINETSNDHIRKLLVDNISREYSKEAKEDLIESDIVDDLVVGETINLEFKDSSDHELKELSIKPTSNGMFFVNTTRNLKSIPSKGPSLRRQQLDGQTAYSREELINVLNDIIDNLTDESTDLLFVKDELRERISTKAMSRLTAIENGTRGSNKRVSSPGFFKQ